MATLGAGDRMKAQLIALLAVGLLGTFFTFYCKIYELNLSGKKNEPVPVDRPKAYLLIENKDKSVASELARQVRVLCWVMTQPDNHEKLTHIKATWGKRCNVLLFMSTSESKSAVPTISLPVREGEEYQWAKTKAAFRYVHQRYRDDADWFLKADDDTYVIVENLRYMLAGHNTSDPIYFGCRFKHRKQGYMSGGAGYVLSRGALDKLVDEGLSGKTLCRVYDHGQEDLEMGKCMSKIGVVSGDSRDALRRGRFFPFRVEDHLFPSQDKQFWYWYYIYYPTKDGLDCCSENAISFHYFEPKNMYVLDYLIYQLRPYGIEYKTRTEPKILDRAVKNAAKYDEKLVLNRTSKNAPKNTRLEVIIT